jgi:hypothetical protein
VPASPLPRRLERAGPHAEAGRPSVVLRGDVIPRVSAVGERQALRDQPFIDVEIVDETPTHDAPIPVDVALVAGDGAPPNQILQRQGGALAAAPVPAGCIETGLPAFRRIDAVKPDTLVMNLDGVGIDDGSDADHIGMGGTRRRSRRLQR